MVTQVHIGPDVSGYGLQAPEEHPEQYKVVSGTTHVSVGENASSSNGSGSAITSVNMASVDRGQGGILSTALNAMGSATARLDENTSVEVEPGMRVGLATAARLGYLNVDAQGNYSDSQPQAAPSAVAKAAPQAAPQDASALDGPQDFGQAEQAFSEAIEPIPQDVFDSALHAVAHNGLDALDLNAIAAASGLTMEQGKARFDMVYGLFQARADSAVGRTGMDPQAVYDWAHANKPKEIKAATEELLKGRSTRGLTALAKEYMRSMNVTDSALNQAGIKTGVDPISKQRMVNINGAWTSERAARLGGLI